MAQAVAAKPEARKHKLNRTKVNLYLDIVLTVLFIVEMEEHFTGLALHELLGLFFGVVSIIHIILHWDWIVSLTRTFSKKLLHESRVNYVLNILLFIDMMLVTVSGILISKTLGLELGITSAAQETWKMIHFISSELVLVIVAVHVAMHWKWILTNTRKYVLGWLPGQK